MLEVAKVCPLVGRSTGPGCKSAALVRIFVTPSEAVLLQTKLALGVFSLAAELVAHGKPGLDTFGSELLDGIHATRHKGVAGHQNIRGK